MMCYEGSSAGQWPGSHGREREIEDCLNPSLFVFLVKKMKNRGEGSGGKGKGLVVTKLKFLINHFTNQ